MIPDEAFGLKCHDVCNLFSNGLEKRNMFVKRESKSGKLFTVVCAKSLQLCWILCDPVAIAGQAPLSVEFSRQEYWSRLPFPFPGDLPDPGIKPVSLVSLALVGRFFTTSTSGKSSGEYG